MISIATVTGGCIKGSTALTKASFSQFSQNFILASDKGYYIQYVVIKTRFLLKYSSEFVLNELKSLCSNCTIFYGKLLHANLGCKKFRIGIFVFVCMGNCFRNMYFPWVNGCLIF